MALNVSLPVDFEGTTHYVAVSDQKNGYNISVDGMFQSTQPKGTATWIFGEQADLMVNVAGANMIVAVRGNVARLVYNGQYIDTGESCAPAQKMPGWIWVFVVLNALIPIISLGGFINIMLAMGAIFLCGYVVQRVRDTTAKILACVGVTVAAWVIWWLLILIITAL